MDVTLPSFRDVEGGKTMSGIYGTRFVEYLTITRFDENDRAPEVFAAHVQAALQQMWGQPHAVDHRR